MITSFIIRYWNWLKETGGEYFRSPFNPNQRMQDGFKEKLLCDACEGRFSSVETPFADRLFRPLMANPQARLEYGPYAVRCLISLLWRQMALDFDEHRVNDHPFKPLLERAEQEWRLFLLDKGDLSEFNRLHLFITDFPKPESPQHNVYLTRVADYSVAWTSSACALYMKFAKFIVWAEITPYDPANWVNTLVSLDSGTLQSAGQEIRDRGFGSFLLERAQNYDKLQEESRTQTSPRQQQKISAYAMQNVQRIANSELGEAMLRDAFGAPVITIP